MTTFTTPRMCCGCLLMLLALTLGMPGCGGPGQTSNTGPGESSGDSTQADNVLRRMVKAYQRADSYSDEALIRVKYRLNGQAKEESSTQSVKFKRPNQVALHVEQEYFTADVICDGTTLVAQVKEPDTLDLGKQMVVLPAPQRFQMRDFEADEILFNNYITRVLNVAPTQLELLVESKPLSWMFADNVSRRLLDEAAIDGRPCFRVQVDAVPEQPEQGHFVFWIDKASYLLRRLEYPPRDLPAEFQGAEVFVDFDKAAFNGQLNDQDFRFDVPSDAVQVRYFVPPSATLPLPLELYGTRPDFTLLDAEGQPVTRDSLAGKYVVLAWFDDTPGSQEVLRQLEAFRTARRDDAKLQVFAVGVKAYQAADPAALMERWNCGLPLLIDDNLHHTPGIEGVPHFVLLDGTGAIQYSELGVNPDSASASLTPVLERLARGENVAETERKQLQADLNRYQEALTRAQGDRPSAVFEIPEVKIQPAKDPARLKLTPAWTNAELAAAGNVLPIEAAEGVRLLVLDGWRTVVEVDEQGQTVARHELPIGDNAAVSYLRTAVDKNGKRWYAASFRMGTKAYLFNENWKLVLTYPPQEDSQESVRDVQLADLRGDGEPELLIGFWGLAGVHSVSLAGKRMQWNRIYPSIFSLAVSGPNPNTGWRKLIATGSGGGILELNQFLRHDPPYTVENRSPSSDPVRHMQSVFAAQYDGGDVRFCGIAETTGGKPVALGLAEGPLSRLEEVWSYGLPGGVMTQVESVTSGRLLDDPGGEWLLAGADGSLHVVGQDARFNDYWALGKAISGLAVTRINDRPAVVISSGTEVAAWYVEPLPAPQP